MRSYLSLVALAFSILLATAAHADDKPAADRHPALGDDVPEAARRVVSFFNIGGSPSKDYRLPHYMGKPKNWADFIENHVEPEYTWGCRRWLIHNPFGDPPTGPMAFDQFLLAKEKGIDKVTEDFVEAWSAFFEKHPDTEVIFYLGKLHGSKRLEQHLPERPDLWLERAMESVRPILALAGKGASLSFDAATGADKGSRTHRFVQLIESLGVRTYVESWPHNTRPWWGEFNVVCAEKRRGVYATGGAGVEQEKIAGEIVWLINGNLAKQYKNEPDYNVRTPEGQFKLSRDLLKTNPHYAVAPPVRSWIKAGLKLEELMEE